MWLKDFFGYLQLALLIYQEGSSEVDAIKAGQPVTLGDPASGGPVKTYMFGKHVAVGPIPINPVP